MKGVVVDTNVVEIENEIAWSSLLEIWPRDVHDLADSVLLIVARRGGHAVASFDHELRRRLERFEVSAYALS